MDTTLLILHNLKKSYGNKTAVNIDSLAIQPHSFTCIVGKSGCGKTTLLRLLTGLETPDTVTNVKDQTAASYSTSGQNTNVASCITGLPAKTAPVFQEPRLMPWLTVKENIMFSLKGQVGNVTNSDVSLPSPEDRCNQLLNELELTDAAGLYPAQLSGGMAQRVSLGRTLFYDPELILMDEKKTILFVTHDVEEALLLGDRILVMENGNIKADMPVNLPTPLKAADSELQKMRQQILDLLAE